MTHDLSRLLSRKIAYTPCDVGTWIRVTALSLMNPLNPLAARPMFVIARRLLELSTNFQGFSVRHAGKESESVADALRDIGMIDFFSYHRIEVLDQDFESNFFLGFFQE